MKKEGGVCEMVSASLALASRYLKLNVSILTCFRAEEIVEGAKESGMKSELQSMALCLRGQKEHHLGGLKIPNRHFPM